MYRVIVEVKVWILEAEVHKCSGDLGLVVVSLFNLKRLAGCATIEEIRGLSSECDLKDRSSPNLSLWQACHMEIVPNKN